MIRQDNQKVKDFILELHRQAAKCNFDDQLHVQLRDRFIAGINIPGLEKELLRMPNCSFQDARTACINYEAVNELDIQSMKISNTLLSRHDEIQSQGRSNLRSFSRDFYSRGSMKVDSTRNCKANNEDEKKFGKCLSCGKFHYHSDNSAVPDDHLSLSTTSKENVYIQKRLYTSLGSFHDFIVDTGSIESIISFKNLKYLDPNFVVRPTEVSILGITGHRLPIRGCCELLIRNANSSYAPCEFLVSETGLSILGLKNLKRLKVELSPLVSTDASSVGIGAVLEQEGRPVICVSRKLTVTEQGYSQTQREALAVFWAFKRLHKYLFGKKFTIANDHEALKFIYHPEKSLARSSAAMVQRWSTALSAYDYTVQHRSAKQIQHADYISRQPLQDRPVNTSDCLLVQPLPGRRPDLIRELVDTLDVYSALYGRAGMLI
ncbi:unnamed protein product [Schistosoma rodhaini]|nr:unnamed protein product [Schistosoma rodhaini]